MEQKDFQKLLINCEDLESANIIQNSLQSREIAFEIFTGKNKRSIENLHKILITTEDSILNVDMSNFDFILNTYMPQKITAYKSILNKYSKETKEGKMLTYFTTHDELLAKDLMLMLIETNQDIPIELAQLRMLNRYNKRSIGSNSRK